MSSDLTTDYVIVGAGAVGLAFADVLLTETDADIVIVDRRHMPGGHWNDAYPFVTLHQPSAFYGVSSVELSSGHIDRVGLNAGMGELASGPRVLSYFDEVMHRRFLPSGRVRYLPSTEFLGDGRYRRIADGSEFTIKAGKRVDATYYGTTVPATHTPAFEVDAGVKFCPPNDLPGKLAPGADYVIAGGGKTAMDACLWLLSQGVAPDRIRWVRPREGWMIDRQHTQAGADYFEQTIGNQAAQMEACAAADGVEDLFDRLEAAGCLVRIDPDARPTMFHGATVSQAELAEMRRVRDVIRLGHIRAIRRDLIVLDAGEAPTTPDTVHIDCTARAVELRPTVPVFQGDLITLQTVRMIQPVFSAAFAAHVEAAYGTDKQKNHLTQVVPLPNHDVDWIRAQAQQMMNQLIWSQDKPLREWLAANRLDGFTGFIRTAIEMDQSRQQLLDRVRAAAPAAMQNIVKMKLAVEARAA